MYTLVNNIVTAIGAALALWGVVLCVIQWKRDRRAAKRREGAHRCARRKSPRKRRD